MQGVIKKLIIIHLGSMHEPIHPNRWINSERGDESAGGRNRRTPSVRLCGSGLRVPGKLQEARRRLWAPSPGPSLHPHHPRAEGAWWSLLIWEPLLVFEGGDWSAWVAWNPLCCFSRQGVWNGQGPPSSHGLWKPPSSILFLSLPPSLWFPPPVCYFSLIKRKRIR